MFPSKLEGEVYKLIKYQFPSVQFQIQHKILVKPASPHFPPRFWKVDFYIPQWEWLIEAKGMRTREWKQQLEALDLINPGALNNLSVVAYHSGEVVCKGVKTINLAELKSILAVRVAGMDAAQTIEQLRIKGII